MLNILKQLDLSYETINPIILAKNNSNEHISSDYLVIDGIKKNTKNVYYSDFQINEKFDQLKLWLDINIKYRKINDAEFIILINTYKDFDFSKYTKNFDIFNKCNNFDINILKFLTKNNNINTIKYLYTCDQGIRKSISNILETYCLNSSSLINLIEFSNDIFLKTNVNILNNNEFIKLLRESGTNTALNYLYENRFPKTVNKKKEIDKHLKNLNLNISYDKSFEAKNLSINFSSIKDVKNIIKSLSSNLNEISKVIDIYKK